MTCQDGTLGELGAEIVKRVVKDVEDVLDLAFGLLASSNVLEGDVDAGAVDDLRCLAEIPEPAPLCLLEMVEPS